ncbi:MAG: TetR/AcrR family transcriptional regulator [Gammaproteobacteria bacterium]|nr:TetR/AcrR family transcriptional regulator [Gammaproteobacteria bacterium]MYH85828.1 TetR/AcrR family transcriptional regulator [Gammaproteobacteria bacterium]MYK05340.1 TetR/AcrR family transcriptional regulator [Gammaproteobacteria bacterium]
MTSSKVQAKHSPGRPSNSADDPVSDRLLQAAKELFSSYEYRAVSIRQIAAHAGVNTAMVHYYFGDKEGLYRNMTEKVSLPVEDALKKIAARDDLSIAEFIKVWMKAMYDNPWYPVFILKEGILGQGPVHRFTSTRLSEVMAPALQKALENDRKNNRLRKELDLTLVAMSLVSLLNYPFLIRPLFEKTLGISFDQDQFDILCDHTTDIFLHGVLEYEGNPGSMA